MDDVVVSEDASDLAGLAFRSDETHERVADSLVGILRKVTNEIVWAAPAGSTVAAVRAEAESSVVAAVGTASDRLRWFDQDS